MSNNTPLVTIRCITYNHEPYIRQCLEGFVMQQTNFKFEAIVHDDASTDGTAAIVAEFAEKYPDIIKPIFQTENQYSKKNGAIRKALNEATRGKYIALCEGDDYWTDPLKLQKQVDFLEANPDYGMCHTAFKVVDMNSEPIHKIHLEKCMTKSFSGDVFSQILLGNYVLTCTVCYRAELYKSEILNKTFSYDFLIYGYLSGHSKVAYINEETSCYRSTPMGAISLRANEFVKKKKEVQFYLMQLYVDKHFFSRDSLNNKLIVNSIAKVLASDKLGYSRIRFLICHYKLWIPYFKYLLTYK